MRHPRTAALAAGACALALAPAASAATPVVVSPDGPVTAFENYDRVAPDATASADWPVTMIFTRNASVAKVKLGLARWMPFPGSVIHEYWRQGGASGWDADRGIKTKVCSLLGPAIHLRLYAPPAGYFSGTSWGRYVVATTHQDRGECGLLPRAGWSEDAEATVSSFAARRGWRVTPDDPLVDLGNAETAGLVGTRYWQSDGHPTIVEVR